jgi:hypothetical protein
MFPDGSARERASKAMMSLCTLVNVYGSFSRYSDKKVLLQSFFDTMQTVTPITFFVTWVNFNFLI